MANKITLPHNLDAEKSLLNCLFLAKKGKHEEIVTQILNLNEDVFYSDLHRTIFIKFKELIAKGMTPDAIALDYFINDVNLAVLAKGSLLDYLVDDVFQMEASAFAAPIHIDILKDLANRRSLLNKVKEFNKNYIEHRDRIISNLLDTSIEINEEEINNFLFTSN